MNQIDILLLSETHFTNKNFAKIPDYNIHNTNHPSGSAHGGSAIIIKKSIKQCELSKYTMNFLQGIDSHTNLQASQPINYLSQVLSTKA